MDEPSVQILVFSSHPRFTRSTLKQGNITILARIFLVDFFHFLLFCKMRFSGKYFVYYIWFGVMVLFIQSNLFQISLGNFGVVQLEKLNILSYLGHQNCFTFLSFKAVDNCVILIKKYSELQKIANLRIFLVSMKWIISLRFKDKIRLLSQSFINKNMFKFFFCLDGIYSSPTKGFKG